MKSPEGDVRLLRGFPYPSVAAGSSECQAGRVLVHVYAIWYFNYFWQKYFVFFLAG